MLTVKTFDLSKDGTRELTLIARVLECIRIEDYAGARAALVERRDELTTKPPLKDYNPQREAA